MSLRKMSLVIMILVLVSVFISPTFEEVYQNPETLMEPRRPETEGQNENDLWQSGGRIVFQGALGVWAIDPDGGNETLITPGGCPAWSPDGKKIAVTSGYDIWVVDADGSNRTQLTFNPASDGCNDWSPDGRIVFQSERTGTWQLWVMDADGGNLTQLLSTPMSHHHPTWSPDGKRIAFDSRYIWVVDADGSNLTQLTFGDSSYYPAWSPDGSKIAYSHWDDVTRMDIWVMNADGSNQTQLTYGPEYEEFPGWSPDSRKIAYGYGTPFNYDLWVVDISGANAHKLSSTSGRRADPDWCCQSDFNDTTPPTAPVIQMAVLTRPDYGDVKLTWFKSEDEWHIGGTVKYEVWRSTGYFDSYVYLDQVMANDSSLYHYLDNQAGEGNPSNYFYRVYSVDASGNKNESRDTAGKFTRELQVGPNLVSIPLTQWDERPEIVFQTLKWDKVWCYDSANQKWEWHMTFKPYKGSLREINYTMGIWVNVTQDSNLTVAGVVPTSTTIDLQAGWNLVGFPSFDDNYTVADLKAAVVVERIEGFDALALPYFLRVMADGDFLQTGFGYWIRVESSVIWTIENL